MPEVRVPVVTVISTFAGCGGSSLGYQMAGFTELLAVEWDDNAVETFKLNFPDVPVYHGDIAKLTGIECLRLAGIKKGELDILDGSPPCQGFSTAGKRKFNDPRNSLFMEFARLLRELQPKVFVMENVTGMVKGVMKQAYLTIIKTLRDCGYRAKGEVLNAMYFNVPQSRERVIIIGVRNDLNLEPSHPPPLGQPIVFSKAVIDIPGGSPVRKILKPERYKAAREGEPLYSTYSHAYRRLRRDSPAGTITKGSHQIHPVEDRELNGREIARLTSYPDEYSFIGGHQDWVDRIGNSVPPLLMKAIAGHIRMNILKSPTQ